MRFLLFGGLFFGKMWKNLEKRPFFQTDTAGLGKYYTGGYGRIGVYRVNHITQKHSKVVTTLWNKGWVLCSDLDY